MGVILSDHSAVIAVIVMAMAVGPIGPIGFSQDF